MRPGPDWFTDGYAQAAFEHHLLPLAGRPKFRALQIGAYCGDATIWLLDRLLTGEDAVLTDVDTWEGSKEHEGMDFDAVLDYYLSRPRIAYGGGLRWTRCTSDEFFARSQPWEPFDFIYVDGSHEADQVLRDAVHAEQVLRPGGLLAFDDYQWGPHLPDRPQVAIDAFLRVYESKFDVLEVGLQVWVRKR